MKGDIAVAGLMITAEEWQALDAASRAQLVAVITRQDPLFANGSGPVLAVADVPHAMLAEGTNPGIEVPEVIEELPSGAVIAES